MIDWMPATGPSAYRPASASRPVAAAAVPTQPGQPGPAGGITFGVLGPLAAWRGGEPMPLPPPTGRRLLAALIVSGGKLLRPAELAALARDGYGPGCAEADDDGKSWAQVGVSRLRAWLARATGGAVTLEFHSFGYRLQLGSAQTDLALFHRWFTDAQHAESPARRVELAARALRLWRGEPLLDASDQLRSDPAVTSMHRARLDAACLLASSALAAGTPREALPCLADLAERHPFDERLQGATARLLAADGRQAQALALIDDTIALLADELGVDPGAHLREAQLQILRQQGATAVIPEPTEDAPAVAATPAEQPAPGTWLGPRPAVTSLAGRDADRSGVENLLLSRRLVTVAGAGGTGKTALALDVAERIADRYPAGVAVLSLDSLSCVDQLETAVAELLGIGADQELADVVGQRQMLLVLDNCEHILGPVAELVQSVLRAAPGVSVLTTSRRAIGLASEAVWGLSGLAVDPAVGFFLGRARDAGHPLAESEEGLAEVTRLCVQLDGVPLALELAAAMMRVFTPGQLLKQLGGSDRLALTGRPHGEPRHRSLEACAEWSYRLLSGAERALLCRLSAFGGAFTLEAAGAVCGGGPVSVNGAAELVGLIDHHLVEVTEDDGGRRFRLPFAVREFARRRLATSGDQPATYDRLLDHWLESRPADGDEPPTTR